MNFTDNKEQLINSNVYIVLQDTPYGANLLGVFSTYDKATEFTMDKEYCNIKCMIIK